MDRIVGNRIRGIIISQVVKKSGLRLSLKTMQVFWITILRFSSVEFLRKGLELRVYETSLLCHKLRDNDIV
jgi:hypothetical protein